MKIKHFILTFALINIFLHFFISFSFTQDLSFPNARLNVEAVAPHLFEQILEHVNQHKSAKKGKRIPSRLDLKIMKSTINVPADFKTIQEAIDAAINGDTILVSTGTYKENLHIEDKELTLSGENSKNTIIEGSLELSPTITVIKGNITIKGFTIKRGIGGLFAFSTREIEVSNCIIDNNKNGGIAIANFGPQRSSVKLINNHITNTRLYIGLGGDSLAIINANVIITGNLIEGNSGFGVIMSNPSGSIRENVIKDNKSGLFIFDGSNIEFTGNIVEKNGIKAPISGNSFGLAVVNTPDTIVFDNIIRNNCNGLIIQETSNIDVSNNIINENMCTGVSFFLSDNINVSNNQITSTITPSNKSREDFGVGVLIASSSALIFSNEISNHKILGMRILDSTAELKTNLINNNDTPLFCESSIITGCCNTLQDNINTVKNCSNDIFSCPCPESFANNKLLIKPSSVFLTRIGADVKLTAVIESENGASKNVTKKSTWSSNVNIATVDSQGVVTASGNGETIVCAEFNGNSTCIDTTVNDVHFGINQWTISPTGEELDVINDIVVNPIQTNELYASVLSKKIFKSVDNGDTWQDKSRGLLGDTVISLAIDPKNPEIIYAGAASNLYKSTNSGTTWRAIPRFLGVRVTTLVIDPLNTETIYAGTTIKGVLKSENGGKDWKTLNNGLAFKNIREDSMVIDPINTETLYVAIEETPFGNGKGIFKLIDGGKRWIEVNNGLFKEVQGLTINPKNPQILYAGTFFKGVYKTINGGNEWFELKDSPHAQNLTITVDNASPEVIYLGNFRRGVFMSRNSGRSWTTLNTQLTSHAIRTLKTNPVHPTIHAGANGGPFRFKHAFKELKALPNPDGVSIDIEYKFNKDTGIAPKGFNLYRSTSEDGDSDKITNQLPGVNELLDSESKEAIDTDFLEGLSHVYELTIVDKDGKETLKSFPTSSKPLLESDPGFSLEALEPEKSVFQGKVASFPLTILSQDNFDKEIFFDVSGLPGGVFFAKFIPASGIPPLAVTLNVNTGTSTPVGDFDLTVRATAEDEVDTEIINLNILKTNSNESKITQIINATNIRVDDNVEITGEIIPPQQGEEVTIKFISPDGLVTNKTTHTNENGIYSIIEPLNKSGIWSITTSWQGNETLNGSSAQTDELLVVQAITTILMTTNATLETVAGDAITLTGNISPNPGEGRVFLNIKNLDGSLNFNGLVSLSKEGTFSHKFKVAGVTNGELEISTRFDGSDDYGSSEKTILVPILEPVGMAIIVAGGGNKPENTLWHATDNLCNYVYAVLKNRGIPDDDKNNRIFYLHPDPNNDADGDGIVDTDAASTSFNLQNAIENWALSIANVSKDGAIKTTPLTIYMTGPGGIDTFNINEKEIISAINLKNWLNNLFKGLNEKFQVDSFPVNLVIESPQAGSFIDDLKTENGIGAGRVIVASTDNCKEGETECNAGAINIMGDGSTSFTKQFFFGLKIGKSITTSWAESTLTMEKLFDDQRPLLDADGDGIPNEDEDEIKGSLIFINENGNPAGNNEIDIIEAPQNEPQSNTAPELFVTNQRPIIKGFQKNIILQGTSTATLWVIVEDQDDDIEDLSVQAHLFPPKSDKQIGLELKYSEENDRFETSVNEFDLFGLYEVLFVASDLMGNASLIKKTLVNSQTIFKADFEVRVFDKDSSEPMEGAKVKLLNGPVKFDGITQDNGSFVFFDIPASVYDVFASKKGYRGKLKKNVEVRQPYTQLDMELRIEKSF